MEIFSSVLMLLSGIAMFLFGMGLMGDGLKQVAGNKLEMILYKLTSSPIKGILLGTVVTAVIQSSSATTVMVIGFVNSGMMHVSQAIGTIMGANIGTSITGWILCLSYIDGGSGIATLVSSATIAALVAIIGIIFRTFVKSEALKKVGGIMMGFAILMTGMQTMSGSVSSLRTNPTFLNIIEGVTNPLIAILIGIVFTAILQSASASVGILQALSTTGAISFAVAFPITLGIGVGAACPVLLSAIGTSKNGKRTALVYLLNDLFGMVIWGTVFYTVHAFVHFDFMGTAMSPVLIALLNTVFRMATVIVLSPFIRYIERFVCFLIKEDESDREDYEDFDLLEDRLLLYPSIALEQSHKAMDGMARKAKKNLLRAMALLVHYDPVRYQTIQDKENVIDKYEDKVGSYLIKITSQNLSSVQSHQASELLHVISDFERLGDHAVNISKVAQELNEKGINFSEEAQKELAYLEAAVQDIVEMTCQAFLEDDRAAAKEIEPLRECIGMLCDELKLNHVQRLSTGRCDMSQGLPFNDLLTNYERIAAHCSNVAVAIIEMKHDELDTHNYVKNMRELKNEHYRETLESYLVTYMAPLNQLAEETREQIAIEKKKKDKEKAENKEKEKDKDKKKKKDKDKNKDKDKDKKKDKKSKK
ncbi:MAG: Na/Pi cotransporter family protein [Agathobacter sp.]|uniref:Na/Pi cotransporter family protein n=1 Tax=Agathobacter sp. TaxID=2021311 RepID=UPI00257E70EB|nr:Na/Pi cotransporter family protein [Agathobacter sp.]MBQ1681919.1 Na/Pi cotransporter family protein [Agathobacter sp.]